MLEKPKFLQGVFPFTGHGLDAPVSLEPAVLYRVPFDKRAQLIYFRGGNSASQMIYVVLMREAKPMRYFPLGAQSAVHVPLAVVEDLHPETTIELHLAAPAGVAGTLILDIGLMEF